MIHPFACSLSAICRILLDRGVFVYCGLVIRGLGLESVVQFPTMRIFYSFICVCVLAVGVFVFGAIFYSCLTTLVSSANNSFCCCEI